MFPFVPNIALGESPFGESRGRSFGLVRRALWLQIDPTRQSKSWLHLEAPPSDHKLPRRPSLPEAPRGCGPVSFPTSTSRLPCYHSQASFRHRPDVAASASTRPATATTPPSCVTTSNPPPTNSSLPNRPPVTANSGNDSNALPSATTPSSSSCASMRPVSTPTTCSTFCTGCPLRAL